MMDWIFGGIFLLGMLAFLAQSSLKLFYREETTAYGTLKWKARIILTLITGFGFMIFGAFVFWEFLQDKNISDFIITILMILCGIGLIWHITNEIQQRKTKWIYFLGLINALLLILWQASELWQGYQTTGRLAFFSQHTIFIIVAVYLAVTFVKGFLSFTPKDNELSDNKSIDAAT